MAVAWILGSVTAGATPDRYIVVDEQFAGSNLTDFIILRTETDNLGSYYGYRKKTYLDEYSKGVVDGKVVKKESRLLLDVNYSIDPEKPESNTQRVVLGTVNAKDDSVIWADMLHKYEPNVRRKWDTTLLSRLTTNQSGGVHFGKVDIIWGGTITQDVFGNRFPQSEWSIGEVIEDINCLYLRVKMGSEDERRESKLICISPRKSKEVLDHMDLAPIYLIAGSYGTEKEALEQTRALQEKCKQAKYYSFTPEIWSLRQKNDKMVYVIAEKDSMERIKNGTIEAMEKVLGVVLKPISSESFQEKTEVR